MAMLAPRRVRPEGLVTERLRLADGSETSLHLAAHSLAGVSVRVARLRRPAPLAAWCAGQGIGDAIVGGFFTRPAALPLGELRTRGMVRRFVPFLSPWHAERSCLHVERGRVSLARRDELAPEPRGDLLQAGPLLVAGGVPVVRERDDPEGFSTGAAQFDSDITAERHPRAAIALDGEGRVMLVACDGRARGEAGLTLAELAEALAARGAVSALNLDGGGSTSLVCGGALANAPREGDGTPIVPGRPVPTAIALVPR